VTKTRKQFGQHWLKSEKALNSIVAAAQLTNTDRVLEIGPGTGILTRQLLPLAATVVAVEIDRDLCAALGQKTSKIENFLLLQADFLTIDLDELLAPAPLFQHPNKVVANIPYNITGPIIEKLLGTIAAPNPRPFAAIVLLVQKEVALRICSNPKSTHFGALSVRVQYLADAVIRLRPRLVENPPQSPRHLEMIIRSGFSSKRKMLRNNLKSLVEVETLTVILEALGINPQTRAEDISVREWILLSDRLLNLTQQSSGDAPCTL
jgi:16S rRNA (adenine1518-N6/adenine1519-N6)-dimethyltransferase